MDYAKIPLFQLITQNLIMFIHYTISLFDTIISDFLFSSAQM